MSRIADTFARLRQAQQKALVTYLVAGDPSPAESLAALAACRAGGADILEIGIPFSDPMADGEAIQGGHERSLASGMGRDGFWRLLRDYRRQDEQTPIVLMGYYNTLLLRGMEDFVRNAADSGVDGLLVVDMPPEESAELKDVAQVAGLDTILLVAPSTPPPRLQQIAEQASGFLYYVSYQGVTGLARLKVDAVRENIGAVRRAAGELPLAVGFGVRTAQDAAAISQLADGVVVGAALVELCDRKPFQPKDIQQLVAELKGALVTGV